MNVKKFRKRYSTLSFKDYVYFLASYTKKCRIIHGEYIKLDRLHRKRNYSGKYTDKYSLYHSLWLAMLHEILDSIFLNDPQAFYKLTDESAYDFGINLEGIKSIRDNIFHIPDSSKNALKRFFDETLVKCTGDSTTDLYSRTITYVFMLLQKYPSIHIKL